MPAPVKNRIPPIPPPKPINYCLYSAANGNVELNNEASKLANESVKKFAILPGDSDTDSGICADSDNQLSPNRNQYQSSNFSDGHHNSRTNSTNLNLHLTKKCSVSLPDRNCYGLALTSEVHLVKKRRLPQRPVLNGSCNSSSCLTRPTRHYRVRFADQVSFPAELSALPYSSDNNECGSVSSCSSTCFDRPPNNARHFSTNPQDRNQYMLKLKGKNNATDLPSEEVKMLLPPPSYASYFFEAPHLEKAGCTQKASTRATRRYQNRSSSLPRCICSSPFSENQWLCADFTKQPINIEYTVHQMEPVNGNLDRNSGDQFISRLQRSSKGIGGRVLPESPNMISRESRVRQPAFSRQRRVKRTQMEQRSHSVGPSSWDTCGGHTNTNNFTNYRESQPKVEAKLVALDHKGYKTIIIEKIKPGPFGFYIATGIINQRRGIFISRISLPSLMSILSIGDELIYVENELVKGRTLEHVQSLIAGKDVVTIVLLPNSSSALC